MSALLGGLVVSLLSAGVAQAGPGMPTNCGIFDGSPVPFSGGDGYAGAPYQIATAPDLAAITGNFVDCDFIQTGNITLSGEWAPIGSEARVFRGVYDGGSKTISGLTITGSNNYVGLFGATENAVLKNVSLVGVSVAGDRSVGGLVGSATGTVIRNVSVTGAVSGVLRVGGVAGDLINEPGGQRSLLEGATTDVVVTPPVEGGSLNFGGVVGFLSGSDISTVEARGSVSGINEVGGIAGGADSGSTVQYAKSSGAVTGLNFVGGIVGGMFSTQISDSYATGAVTASSMDGVVGGVVGYAIFEDADLTGLERTYALGVVTGTTAGALLGSWGEGVVVDGSYWNKDANPLLFAAGLYESMVSDPPGSTLTALRDIDTYSSWTIVNGWAAFSPPTAVWGICDDVDTPYLLWEETESPCASGWTVTGFFAPVDMDVINRAVAGRVVPLKWRILDESGDPYGLPQSFVKVSSSLRGCTNTLNMVGDDVEKYVAKSGMRYLGDGYWQFNWATPKWYAGQCRTVTLELSDGSTISADFHFRR